MVATAYAAPGPAQCPRRREPSAVDPSGARRADAFIKVSDQDAILIQNRLAAGALSQPPLNIGLSGVAGLAGLHNLVLNQPETAARLGLDRQARVLVFGTEAAPNEVEIAEAEPSRAL